MPVIESTYRPPFLLGNNHLQTVSPTLFRKVKGVNYIRERIETPDGDFIDIDLSLKGSKRAVVLSHGLEGSADRAYVKGMAKAFNKRGWDAVGFNFRSCSGEMNRTAGLYHSGKTEDLHLVIEHVLKTRGYEVLSLVGFSLGANLTLKYAGEMGKRIPKQVKSAIGISAPCDLSSSAKEILKPKCAVYEKRFLHTMIKKVRSKEAIMPAHVNRDYSLVKNLADFDNLYTAPLSGFKDAEDYWSKCSSRRYISGTAIPTLIINAKDDPILGPECFPWDEARASDKLFLEAPDNGGHVGFITFGNGGEYWDETRTAEFAEANR